MGEKSSVQEIMVERLINKINEEGRLPWQRPFISPCINWFSKTEYKGVNKVILDGGEYITPNQLKKYNEKVDSDYWFEKGTPYEIVVFYKSNDKDLTPAELDKFNKSGGRGLPFKVIKTEDGLKKRLWILNYYRVYNIKYIKNKAGEMLEPRLGSNIIETFTPADDIINNYKSKSGVKVLNDANECYYTDNDDAVHLTPTEYFASSEAMYRTIFHELAHSTGVVSRLNRQCFIDYSKEKKERGREELIAEMTSLLLASEAGFKDDSPWVDNSDIYIKGWVGWMKDNKSEVLSGMLASEKAKDYILNGPAGVDDMNVGCVASIKGVE